MGSSIRVTARSNEDTLSDNESRESGLEPTRIDEADSSGSTNNSDSGPVDAGTTGPAPEPDRRRSQWIAPAAILLILTVVLVSAVIGVLSTLSARSASSADARDREVLDVASTMAVNLVTLGQDSADSDLARVIDGTTGDFREQFVTAADGFGELLTEGGVVSVGEVKSAGIVDSSDDAATVLAAVTSTVKNNEAPDGEVRVYRMKLELANVDGNWLVSNVEFVA